MFKYNFINLIGAAISAFLAVNSIATGDGLWLSTACFIGAGILFVVTFFINEKKKKQEQKSGAKAPLFSLPPVPKGRGTVTVGTVE